MTDKELVQLCKLGESTTMQYKLEFTTQKQIAEELVAFANTRGGIIIFGVEDNTGRMVGLTYEQVQYTSRELGNTANEHVRPIIYIETEIIMHEEMAYLIAYVKNGFTTQKANVELISTTQKEEKLPKKIIILPRSRLQLPKNAILDYLKEHSTATRQEVAAALGNITEDGVKYNIGKLQQYGRLKREKAVRVAAGW